MFYVRAEQVIEVLPQKINDFKSGNIRINTLLRALASALRFAISMEECMTHTQFRTILTIVEHAAACAHGATFHNPEVRCSMTRIGLLTTRQRAWNIIKDVDRARGWQ